jgi:hypothetical protein
MGGGVHRGEYYPGINAHGTARAEEAHPVASGFNYGVDLEAMFLAVIGR